MATNSSGGWKECLFLSIQECIDACLDLRRGKANANVVHGAQHGRAVAGILALDDKILGFGNGAGAATRNTLQDTVEPGLKVSLIDRSGDQVDPCGFDTVYAPTGKQQFHDRLVWHNPQQSHHRR